MNIIIANRLVELRKKSGLSQEELASKLGLSRQAVSKWERAEASPDTDNLICLAKLYNVSLDDLLNTDAPIEEILKETQAVNEEKKQEQPREKIHVDEDSVCVYNADGSERFYAKGTLVRIDGKAYTEFNRHYALKGIVAGCLYALVAAAYLVCGFLFGAVAWQTGWPVFFFPIVVSTLIDAIQQEKWCHFAFPILVTMVYCCIGMVGTVFAGSVPNWLGWHPWWVLFLTIPAYYSIFAAVDKRHAKKELKNGNIVIDNRGEIEEAKREALSAQAKLKLANKRCEELQEKAILDERAKKELAAAQRELAAAEEDLQKAYDEIERAVRELEDEMAEDKRD